MKSLAKARYIEKKPDGKGGWRYIYREPKPVPPKPEELPEGWTLGDWERHRPKTAHERVKQAQSERQAAFRRKISQREHSNYFDVGDHLVRISDHPYQPPLSAKIGDWKDYREPGVSIVIGHEAGIRVANAGRTVEVTIPKRTVPAIRRAIATAIAIHRRTGR